MYVSSCPALLLLSSLSCVTIAMAPCKQCGGVRGSFRTCSVTASCPAWPNKIWDRGHSQKTYWFQLQLLEFIFNCCMFCFVYVNVCYVIIESDVCTWVDVRIMDGIRRSDGRDIYYSRIVQTLSLFQIQTSFTFTAEAEPDCWVRRRPRRVILVWLQHRRPELLGGENAILEER